MALIGVAEHVSDCGGERVSVVRRNEDCSTAPKFAMGRNVRQDQRAAGLRGLEHRQPERLVESGGGIDWARGKEARRPRRSELSEKLQVLKPDLGAIRADGRS